jgi:hypothetical protein
MAEKLEPRQMRDHNAGKEVELTPVTRPCGLYREYIKDEIKKILLSEDLLTEILIDWYGHPTFSIQTWHKYWEPVTTSLSSVGLNILENFGKARRQYIRTKFSPQTMISYCFNYFCLLEEVLNTLKNVCSETSKSALLSKVFGFENFIIRWANREIGAACGTSTIRNPPVICSQKSTSRKLKTTPDFSR